MESWHLVPEFKKLLKLRMLPIESQPHISKKDGEDYDQYPYLVGVFEDFEKLQSIATQLAKENSNFYYIISKDKRL